MQKQKKKKAWARFCLLLFLCEHTHVPSVNTCMSLRQHGLEGHLLSFFFLSFKKLHQLIGQVCVGTRVSHVEAGG